MFKQLERRNNIFEKNLQLFPENCRYHFNSEPPKFLFSSSKIHLKSFFSQKKKMFIKDPIFLKFHIFFEICILPTNLASHGAPD